MEWRRGQYAWHDDATVLCTSRVMYVACGIGVLAEYWGMRSRIVLYIYIYTKYTLIHDTWFTFMMSSDATDEISSLRNTPCWSNLE